MRQGLAALLIAAAVVGIAGGILRFRHPSRIGDGVEYLLQLVAVAESTAVTIDEQTIARFNQILDQRPLPGTGRLESAPMLRNHYLLPGPAPGRYEALHFWFYALLAAPFYPLAHWLRLPFADSFTLLHLALLTAFLLLMLRTCGPRAALASGILLFSCPLVWFLNKAHTEYLTVCCISAAAIWAARKNCLAAALALSLAATQNPLLSIPAVVMLAFRTASGGFTRVTWLGLFACVSFNALSPAYYWWRYQFFNPIAALGISRPSWVTPRRIVSLFFDPNIGLYPHWPLGLLLLLAGVGMGIAMLRRKGRAVLGEPFFWLLVVFLTVVPFVHASQINLNSGGTRHLLRYGLWFVGLHLPALAALFESASRRWFAALLAGLALATAVNWRWFDPALPEVSLRFSAASQRWGARIFGVWDPEREVFLERAGATDYPVEYLDLRAPRLNPDRVLAWGRPAGQQGLWAFSDPGCRLLFVLQNALDSPATRPEVLPAGCSRPLDSRRLFEWVKQQAAAYPGDFYLALDAARLAGLAPQLVPGQSLSLYLPDSDAYLGAGWSGRDEQWRWTDGPAAEVAFSLGPNWSGKRFFIELEAFAFLDHAPALRVEAEVNGARQASLSWTRSEGRKTIRIPAQAAASGAVRLILHVLNPRPSVMPGQPETRRLGLAVRKLTVVGP